jgi:hypothetical protein
MPVVDHLKGFDGLFTKVVDSQGVFFPSAYV